MPIPAAGLAAFGFNSAGQTGKDAFSLNERFIAECEAQSLTNVRLVIALYGEMCVEAKRPLNEYHMRAAVNLRLFATVKLAQVERYARYFE